MNLNTDFGWWSYLGKKDLLQMAILLCRTALPVWEDYELPIISGQEIKFLPSDALANIEEFIGNNKNIKNEETIENSFTLFVTPFIQLLDGDLELPYAVKSSFLSVFYILKGILSKKNNAALESFSTSVSKSLDAIYISKRLTNDQTKALIEKYLAISSKNKNRKS